MAVIVYSDSDAEMSCIEKDGVVIFEGNFWDFKQDPANIVKFLQDVGVPDVSLQKYTYDE